MFGCLKDLKLLFALWKYPLEGVPKNMCLKYIDKTSKRIYLFTGVVIAGVSEQLLLVSFLYDPILPHRIHFIVGL